MATLSDNTGHLTFFARSLEMSDSPCYTVSAQVKHNIELNNIKLNIGKSKYYIELPDLSKHAISNYPIYLAYLNFMI